MKYEYLEQIWLVREKFAARHGYDLHRMVQHLRQLQMKHGDRLVLAPVVNATPSPRSKSPRKASAASR